MNFLIVEDNENMRRTISSILSALAGEINECSDGSEALTAYAAHLPDWVLMDVKMKEMDGITATCQIREAFPKANIMIVSDYDDPDLRIAAGQAGASEYVSKENLFEVYRILCRDLDTGGNALSEKIAR
jgi:DNA-binding NarL/FixJ family response regulator